MSLLEQQPEGMPPRKKRSAGLRVAHGFGWMVVGVVLLVVALLGGFAWYTTTADFQRRVSHEVVALLEEATGGRVELQALRFRLWRLDIKADGLVIHGTEAASERPYLRVDTIEVQLKLTSFLAHTTGEGLSSHVGLSLLRVVHPQFNLIVDRDGRTNQPVPKHPSTTPVADSLLDLKAKHVELTHGMAWVNDKAVPFELAAQDLAIAVQYVAKTDQYQSQISLADLQTKMADGPVMDSRLRLDVALGRDVVKVTQLEFTTGEKTRLTGGGELSHFAQPVWSVAVDGSIDLKEAGLLGGLPELKAGVADLVLRGHSCSVTPVVAQRKLPFWRRGRTKAGEQKQAQPDEPGAAASAAKAAVKNGVKTLPPDPACTAGYLLAGELKAHGVGYQNQYVRVEGLNLSSHLRITPSDLLLTALSGSLPGGGAADGELRIANWLGEAATSSTAGTTPATAVAHAYLKATVAKLPLRTVMEATEMTGYGDLGFDTAINGPLTAEWGGPAADIADTVKMDGDLTFTPTGVRRRGVLNNVPVSGQAVAHYDGRTEVVRIERILLTTPGSRLTGSGVLGVNLGDRLTQLRVDLTVHDLSEYDQLLETLDFEANGKKGAAAVPVVLHGSAEFQGAASGPIADLDLNGHLQGNQIELRLPAVSATATASAAAATDVQVDSVVADGEFSPSSGLAVASSTIVRGGAVLHVGGNFRPRRVEVRRRPATYLWDGGTTVDASVQLANAPMTDVLAIVGQKYPVSGTLDVNGHIAGTAAALGGSGTISLMHGAAYGEGFDSIKAGVALVGRELSVTKAQALLHGMTVTGAGGYDLTSGRLFGHVEGKNLLLSKFDRVRASGVPADGTLSLVADAKGTLEQPGLTSKLDLAKVTVRGEPVGEAAVDLHSVGSVLYTNAHSTLVGASVDATAETQLTGGYETTAKVTLAGLDVAKPLDLFAASTMKVSSKIAGVVTVSGPLKTPKAMRGSADFTPFEVTLEGIALQSAGPLRLSLNAGTLALDQVHITGQDTNLLASGTAEVFGSNDARGGRLRLKATGGVSTALAHTYDPHLHAKGKVEFALAVDGRVSKPVLTGKVQFDHVDASVDGIPNGLTNLDGTLVFNEDRLQVDKLTAMTGGGKITLGGFLTYRNGIYADLSATGDVVRVRLYGLSGTANTALKLQGSPQGLLLSGNVLLTRFGIGPDVDLAMFTGAGGVSLPPDPNSFSNKVRLDVHMTSSPQLDFQNSYAKLAGTVDLHVRGTVAEPTILGRIQITDGSATFAGTKYQLQRGDIYFSNPVRIDPVIDIDATARVENYDISIGLHGTATSIKPTYRSEPPLSEADVFNLLALGRTQEEAQLYQEQQVQQGSDPTTNALLGGALNATVSNRVQKLFGVGSVKIDPAFVGTLGDSAARITVEQQVSQQLTVRYATNVNETAQQLIQVEYQLNRSMSVVATRDETGVFSLVYKIRKRYR